jgi:putative ABC transport system permease protein
VSDLRYVLRQLRKTPLFFCAAVATLAIGTGATTAIFSTVNATLLRPLPFPHPEQLVDVHTRSLTGYVTTGLLSGLEITALNDTPDLVAHAAGLSPKPLDATLMRDDGSPVAIVATGVTDGFFDVVGLPMTMGRPFTHDEHAPGNGATPPIVIASYRAWQTLLNGDPHIVGRTIRIAEVPTAVRVMGVASPLLDLPHKTDFWFNIRMGSRDVAHNYDTILRLRPGVTTDTLRSAAEIKMAGLARTEPSDVGRAYVIRSLVSYLVGDLATTLLIVLGATVLLLVLASVNVTNLLLARGTARAREMAVRSALGASRRRIIRQLLTESLTLATAGVVAGLLLAYVAVRLMLVLGASKLPRLETVPFDGRVLLFSLVVLVCSALTIGLAPAWRLSRTDIRTLLNESGRSATSSRGTSRMMGGLIVMEIAMSLALVAGAGWLVQSFARLRSIDPGFIADGRLIVEVRPTRPFRQPADAHAWSDGVLSTVRAAAGDDARVGASATFPFDTDRDGTLLVQVEGRPRDPKDLRGARIRFATPGFFEAMGVKLHGGRLLSSDDRTDTEHVAVVNRAFVRHFFPDTNPLTGSFAFGYPTIDPKTRVHVVGVVADMRYKSLAEEAEPACYLPFAQVPFPPLAQTVVVAPVFSKLTALADAGRVFRAGDPERLIQPLRAALTRFDPRAVVEFSTATAVVAGTLERQELGMTLMLIFGATALTLAAIGIYGVIAYAASQRRGEIATRIALGASRWDVFRLMMAAGQGVGLAGLLIGIAAAYAGGRLVASNVFGMRPSDPLVLVAACTAVAAVTLIATTIPAVRACRLDPVIALRSE